VIEQDRPEFARQMNRMAVVFGQTVSPAKAEEYYLACSLMSIDAFTAAVDEAIREVKFFPPPVELRALAPTPIERPKPLEADGQGVYVCRYCFDTGWLFEQVMLPRPGRDPYPAGTTSRPCTCKTGEANAARWSKPRPKLGDRTLRDAGREVTGILERWRAEMAKVPPPEPGEAEATEVVPSRSTDLKARQRAKRGASPAMGQVAAGMKVGGEQREKPRPKPEPIEAPVDDTPCYGEDE
jgi:hypothetical protein